MNLILRVCARESRGGVDAAIAIIGSDDIRSRRKKHATPSRILVRRILRGVGLNVAKGSAK